MAAPRCLPSLHPNRHTSQSIACCSIIAIDAPSVGHASAANRPYDCPVRQFIRDSSVPYQFAHPNSRFERIIPHARIDLSEKRLCIILNGISSVQSSRCKKSPRRNRERETTHYWKRRYGFTELRDCSRVTRILENRGNCRANRVVCGVSCRVREAPAGKAPLWDERS